MSYFTRELFKQNDEIRYIINEEKRTVVCLIKVQPTLTADIVDKYLEASNLNRTCGLDIDFLGETFRGIAKCHPEDKWDEEVGCELARKRAEKRADRAINNELSAYVKSLRHAADLIEQYGYRK